ncbi:uncharacterized protein BDR25DRAFT_330394 [Lindgomyces ingoldianus]|uniref:Uncharacterized protein n=1 Tax=Lindgomyces ingoldianus TaxID=673940 RepID=A0ACB6REN0_9PLEO|nr:uncharacterized protein BDR25DRAFT_330394 [Lindgomyces ingoldianus]KAF2477704.1 hypothetical protein BDR25DRAFT_330394 [Lindgomyces ingoldianus]
MSVPTFRVYGKPAEDEVVHNTCETPNDYWLCVNGPYQDYATKLCNSNPALAQPDPENSSIPLSRRKAQLQNRPVGSKNVWIIENINRDMVALLGGHFKMDPDFFLGYERSSKWRRWDHEPNLTPALPAQINSGKYFTLKYCDLRDFGPEIDSYSVSCADTGRHLYRTKWEGYWVSPSIVDRRCSVYRRTTENGGWDILILCDPPFNRVHVWKPQSTINESEYQSQEIVLHWDRPFQRGYPDFVPRSDSLSDVLSGPPRDSLRGDLCYYLLNHTRLFPAQALPHGDDIPFFILRKIIASHYMQLMSFTASYLAQSEWPLLRQESLEDFTTTWAQGRWSEIQGVARRCNEYVENLESLFLSLNVPFDEPKITVGIDWRNTNLDFQFILHRAKAVKTRADELNNAFTGLTGIVGNAQANREAERSLIEAKRSVREAKNMRALTLIAMIFIPLAFTCGLFSMSDGYIPGGGDFWVFFAVSVPLVVLVFFGALLGELGYDEDGVWVWKTFGLNIKRKFMLRKR